MEEEIVSYKDPQKEREYQKKWSRSPEGKKSKRKYRASSKGKKAIKKYATSLKGKKAFRKAQEKYRKSLRGKEMIKQWQKNNPEYNKQRRKDPFHRLSAALSTGINTALKSGKAGRHWENLIHYTLGDLIRHLESQFDDKMNWNNYGSYWEIDHIKPISLFYYDSFDSLEFQECWALENLQPLEKTENRKKYTYYKESQKENQQQLALKG